jgi:hypothetical protein
VPPSFSSFYPTDVAIASVVADCYLTMRSRVCSDSPYLLIRKLGLPVSCSLGLSVLFVSVRNIVVGRAKEKMIGLNARWSVALMQAIHPAWDWAVLYLPCRSMGEKSFSCDPYSAIPALNGIANPNSASSWRTKVTKTLKTLRYSTFCHDALTVAVDGSRVSAAVTARRFESLVPAFAG